MIPASLLIEAHNALPSGDPMRGKIRDYIVACGNHDPKAHWSRAVKLMGSGDLAFDFERYDVAVYRGKQETHTGSLDDALKNVRRALAALQDFHSEEAKAIEKSGVEQGQFLLPMAQYSGKLQRLKGPDAPVGQALRLLAGEPRTDGQSAGAEGAPANE